MPELTRAQRAELLASAGAKKLERERDSLELAMGNLARRRLGVTAEKSAVEKATVAVAIAAHAKGFTYDEIAAGLGVSKQRVGQLLATREAKAKARAAQEAQALQEAAAIAAQTTDDGLVPAVADL